MADQTSQRLKDILQECAAFRKSNNPQQCLEHSKKALHLNKYNIRAHHNICRSLFTLHRYQDCSDACQDALMIINELEALTLAELRPNTKPSLSQIRRDKLVFRRSQRASLVCKRLQRRHDLNDDESCSTVTYKLQNGWYVASLLERIDSGDIQELRHPSFNDACIMKAPEGLEIWGRCVIDGAERRLAVNDVMFGIVDQATDMCFYRKDGIYDFWCRVCYNTPRYPHIGRNGGDDDDRTWKDFTYQGACMFCLVAGSLSRHTSFQYGIPCQGFQTSTFLRMIVRKCLMYIGPTILCPAMFI